MRGKEGRKERKIFEKNGGVLRGSERCGQGFKDEESNEDESFRGQRWIGKPEEKRKEREKKTKKGEGQYR